jgi:hypothetical protein
MSADARTTDFLSLLYGVAHRCGLDPSILSTSEAAALAEHLTVAARKVWRHYDWPDTITLEERLVRPEYATGAYYQSAQNSNTGHAVTDATWWTELDPFALSLTLAVAGDEPMSEIFGVWDRDPDLDATNETERGALPVGFRLTGTTLILDPGAPNSVWVRFRRPSPRFTTTAWDAALTYAAGDVIYYTDRHCYQVLAATTAGQDPTDTPSKFRVQDLPVIFEDAVKRYAKAEWLSSEGQDEKALAQASQATSDLDDATATLSDQQGQTRRYAVATRSRVTRQFQPRRIAR